MCMSQGVRRMPQTVHAESCMSHLCCGEYVLVRPKLNFLTTAHHHLSRRGGATRCREGAM